MSFIVAAAFLGVLQSGTTDLARVEQNRLSDCIELIETDPEAAYEDGLAWSYQGNRPAARYCTAVALIALGSHQEGAIRLEELANAKDAGSLNDRAVYLTQSGNAWLAARQPDAAITTLTNALKLKPSDADIYKDRGAAYFTMDQWTLGIADLNKSIELYPHDPEAYRMRAEAHLSAENLRKAEADYKAALKIEPENIDTLLLRGRVREAIRLSGG